MARPPLLNRALLRGDRPRLALASPALLLAMAVTAGVGGFLTPKHPFDYVYDAAVRPLLGGPSVPPSPAPRRFSCQLATPWVVAIAVAFWAGARGGELIAGREAEEVLQ